METYEETEPTGPETELAELGEPLPVDTSTAGFAPESVNLAAKLTPELSKEYADKACKDYDTDWDSSTKYRTRRAKILKLAIGDIPPPADGEKFRLARIHYPIIMTAVLRIAARIYDQQFPSNGEFFGVKPMDATDLARAVRVAKHLNWQVTHKIPEYVPNHDVLINQCMLYGSAFSYTYWGADKNRPCHEACRSEDIVLPYKRHSSDPSLADVPRITRIQRLYRHELEDLERKGYYVNVKKLYEKLKENEGGSSGEEDSHTTGPIQEAVDRDSGVEKPSTDPDGSRVILEQHRWLKLKGEDRERPVIVTVDYGTKTLLGLTLREDEDPEDRARFNREKASNKAMFEMAMQKYDMDLAAYQAGMMQRPAMSTPMPMQGEQTMTPPPMMGETTATMPMGLPPTMPTPPEEPEAPKMIPIHFFTHYICIPNPEGIYGLGIGSLLEGHNVAADTLASQYVDAATLSNTATGLRSRQAKLRGGEMRIVPGEFPECDLSPQDLAKGLFQIKFPGPEPAMRELIKDQQEAGQEVSGANEIMSGEVGGSNETATTTQIRIGQAMQGVAILNKRYSLARAVEGRKLARLNSVHLDDVEYFSVIDPFKEIPHEPEQISRMDYLEDCDVTITADPRMASQPQRFQEALQAWNLVNASPTLAQMPPLIMAVAKNLFIAMDRPDLLKGFEQGMAFAAPPPVTQGQPGGGGPPQQGAPPKEGGGPPRPEPSGPTVPNGGNQPANGGQTT